MRRITTGFLLALAAAFTFGCGGSSAPLPETGNQNGNGDGSQFDSRDVVPGTVSGSYNTSNLPGQVNVVTGASEEELGRLAEGHGYSVLKYDAGYATLQVPVGAESDAIVTLEKEYSVISAEPVRVINTPTFRTSPDASRAASFYPQHANFGEITFGFRYAPGNTPEQFIDFFIGSAMPYNIQKFNAGWETTIANGAVASQPVTIAIIDAGWFDYSVDNQPGLNDPVDTVPGSILDEVNSGSVDGTGNFTAGLTAATWELDSTQNPYRTVATSMLGILAAGSDGFVATIRAQDMDGSGEITEDEVWNEGTFGANPNATYMLIKTGSGDGTTWSFTDNEIAESIDHAVGAGANIILLGMFAPGTVSGNVSAAIANARANDVLVVAPAGDVVDTYDNQGTPESSDDIFTGTAVDIQTTEFTPASDPNVLSVTGSGVNRIGPLGDVDPGPPPIPNNGTGWFPQFGNPWSSVFTDVAYFCNTGADIAGVGFGMGFGPRPYLNGGPGVILPGFNYWTSLDRFGSNSAAAYVAGAASMVFQTLSEVNGVPPTVAEVETILLNSIQYRGMTGVDDPNFVGPDDGGLLDAGLAVTNALEGGNLIDVLPSMQLTTIQASQPFAFVTRGTDFSLTMNLVNGTAPFELTVDWGDGTAATVIPNWVPGTIVTKTGGYENLGLYALNVIVTDDNGLTDTEVRGVTVHNPLAATITVENAAGAAVPPTALKAATEYRFLSNVGNVYTGDGNTTSYSWDFNGDGTPDETVPTPSFTYPAAGNYTITLTITESLRPDTVRTLDVIVAP